MVRVQTLQTVPARAPFHHRGAAGWALTACLVLAWDSIAQETMTESFRQVKDRPGVVLAYLYLTGHLFDVWPRRYDPLDIAHQAWLRLRARQ